MGDHSFVKSNCDQVKSPLSSHKLFRQRGTTALADLTKLQGVHENVPRFRAQAVPTAAYRLATRSPLHQS